MNATLLDASLIERTGWMLLHACWQFTAVALALKMLLQFVPREFARVRYSTSVGALCAMALLAAGTFALIETQTPILRPTHPVLADAVQAPDALPLAIEHTVIPIDPIANVAIEPPPAALAPADWSESWQSQLSLAVEPWLAWIVSAWLAGIALASARPGLGWFTLRRLRRIGLAPVPQHVADLLQLVAQRLRVRQAVEIALSSLVEVPLVVGWLRPLVLLPASAVVGLTPAQLQAVLAHELAHIRRHDFLVNVLQTIFETLFFHHPAVWWVSSRLRQEREHCCDDLALELCPDRKEYARMLLSLEELRTVVPALSVRGGALTDRVRRILGTSRPEHGAARSASAGLVILTIGLMLWLRPAASIGQTVTQPTPREKASSQFDGVVGNSITFTDGKVITLTDSVNVTFTEAAAEHADHQKGRLTGRFVFHDTDPPSRRYPLVPAGTLSFGKNFGVPNVIIYVINPVPKALPPEAESLPAARLQFVEGKFEPHVQALRTAQPLVLENRGGEPVDFGAQPAQSEGFRKLLPPAGRMALTLVEEALPVKITSNRLPEVSAYVLPRDTSWFAVSGEDGSFAIDDLPPGKWQFQIWHELDLQRNVGNQGQLGLEIKPGQNSLGDFSLQPAMTAELRFAPESFDRWSHAVWRDANAAQAQWFRPDPYPGLGFDAALGDVWMYVRIAADAQAGTEAGLKKELQHFAQTTQKLIEASIQKDSLEGKTTPESRQEWWARGQQLVREQLTPAQDERIQQLLLQRAGYRAFQREDVRMKLELTAEQKNQILAAIEVHEAEAALRQHELEVRIGQLRSALGPENRDLIQAGVKRLKEMAVPGARSSTQGLWIQIHQILLPAQRATFDSLRGPMPPSAQKAQEISLKVPVFSRSEGGLTDLLIEVERSQASDSQNDLNSPPEQRPR